MEFSARTPLNSELSLNRIRIVGITEIMIMMMIPLNVVMTKEIIINPLEYSIAG